MIPPFLIDTKECFLFQIQWTVATFSMNWIVNSSLCKLHTHMYTDSLFKYPYPKYTSKTDHLCCEGIAHLTLDSGIIWF